MLAAHGDGTLTVKYANGKTEEDVPKACIRAEGGRERRGGARDHGSRWGRANNSGGREIFSKTHSRHKPNTRGAI